MRFTGQGKSSYNPLTSFKLPNGNGGDDNSSASSSSSSIPVDKTTKHSTLKPTTMSETYSWKNGMPSVNSTTGETSQLRGRSITGPQQQQQYESMSDMELSPTSERKRISETSSSSKQDSSLRGSLMRNGSTNLLFNHDEDSYLHHRDEPSKSLIPAAFAKFAKKKKVKSAPKILRKPGTSRLLQKSSSSQSIDEEEKKIGDYDDEREYTIDFYDVSYIEVHTIPRIKPDEFDACFYEPDELAEFRYEAHCEEVENHSASSNRWYNL